MENNNKYNQYGPQGQYGQQPPYGPQGQYGQQPPYGPQGPQYPQMPPNSNMVWAILTTILCCLPFGIVAIVYASKVEGLWAGGFHEAAYDAAKKAGMWSIISAVTSFVIGVVYGILMVCGVFADVLAAYNP